MNRRRDNVVQQEIDENLSKLKSNRTSFGNGAVSSSPERRAQSQSRGTRGGPSDLGVRSPRSAARHIFQAAKERDSFSSRDQLGSTDFSSRRSRAGRNGAGLSTDCDQESGLRKLADLEEALARQGSEQLKMEAEIAHIKARNGQLADSLSSTSSLLSGLSESFANMQSDLQALQKNAKKNTSAAAVDRIPLMTREAVDLRDISEQVFQRVHREFNTVVTDVVRACITEQNHRVSETVQGYINVIDARYKETQRRDQEELARLGQRIDQLEAKVRGVQSAVNDRGLQFEQIQSAAVQSYRGEMQTVLEVMTKKMNDCIAMNNSFASEKPLEIEKRVVSNVNASLNSLCSKLELRSEGCESAIKNLIIKSQEVDNYLSDLTQKLFRTESLASHALNASSNTQVSSSPCSGRQQADCFFLQANSPHGLIPQSPKRAFSGDIGEAVMVLERDQSSTLSRLNILSGEMDDLKAVTAVLKSQLNEKFEEFRGHISNLADSVKRVSSNHEFVETLIKRHEVDILASTNKLSSESSILRSEISTCLSELSELKKDVIVVKDGMTQRPTEARAEKMMKRLLLKALASDSPTPRILVTSPSPVDIDEQPVHPSDASLVPPETGSPLFRPVPLSHTAQNVGSLSSKHSSPLSTSSPSFSAAKDGPSEKSKKRDESKKQKLNSSPLPESRALESLDADSIREELVDVLHSMQKTIEDKCISLISSQLGQHAKDESPQDAPNSGKVSKVSDSPRALSSIKRSNLVEHVEETLTKQKTSKKSGVSAMSKDIPASNAVAEVVVGKNVGVVSGIGPFPSEDDDTGRGFSPVVLSQKKREHRRKFQQEILQGRAFS